MTTDRWIYGPMKKEFVTKEFSDHLNSTITTVPDNGRIAVETADRSPAPD